MLLDMVERLLRRNAHAHLRNILKKIHPADIAHLLRLLDPPAALTVFDLLPDNEIAAEVLSEMQPSFRNEFLQNVDVHRLVEIMAEMADDDTADLLAGLPEEVREQVLALMSEEDTQEVAGLLSYPPDTAGRIMTTDYLALPETMTARRAIEEVRKAAEKEMVFYLYVVDDRGHLAGVLSLRQLVIASDDTPLAEIMIKDVHKVHVTTDQEEAARMVSRYNLLAIPVVDDDNVLVGIITVDDIIDVLREEATEDILKMAGTSGEEVATYSVWRSAKVRLPWLFAAWMGGIISVVIIGIFQGRFSTHMAIFASLAGFIPIINGMGGNIGTQSLSLTVRGLATGRIDPKDLWRTVFKEIRVGTLLGIVYGLLLGIAGWVLKEDLMIGAVVGIAMCTNMIMAALIGAFLPLIMVKLKVDPAVASGPFITTSIDVLGVSLYFTSAFLLLAR